MAPEERIRKSRLLLLDGNPAASDRLRARLAQAGWTPYLAADEIEAFTAVRSRGIDLALLHLRAAAVADTDLPNVLRQVAATAYLPVVVLADALNEQQRCRFLDSGADDAIGPRTSAEEMVARIGALLRLKDLHDQLAASRSALEDALNRERRLLAKLRKDNQDLRRQATTDPLTHVQNVRAFRQLLAHEFRIARRYGQALSLLMLDVDHFKVVNDTHGHPSGDYVLKELAVILKQTVRASDVVARAGGEEFVVLLPQSDRRQAQRFAERMRREVYRRKFNVYGRDIHVTVSVGSASYPQDAEIVDADMLLYFADQALLQAKETGRDRVVAVGNLPRDARARLRHQYLETCRSPEDPSCASPPQQPQTAAT